MIRACWACWACQWFNKLKSSKSSTRIPKIMIQVIIVLSITGFILSHAFAADNLSYQVNTITLHGVHPYYLAMHSLGEKALIVDSSNAAIYLVSTTDDSSIELFAGQPGEHGWRDGQRITGNKSSAALLHSPTSICLDPISGNIFFLDRGPAESNASSAVATVLRMIVTCVRFTPGGLEQSLAQQMNQGQGMALDQKLSCPQGRSLYIACLEAI